jgi:hypothetical protein
MEIKRKTKKYHIVGKVTKSNKTQKYSPRKSNMEDILFYLHSVVILEFTELSPITHFSRQNSQIWLKQ